MSLVYVLGRSEVNRCFFSIYYFFQDYRGERIFLEERLFGREVRFGSLGLGLVQFLKIEYGREFCMDKLGIECIGQNKKKSCRGGFVILIIFSRFKANVEKVSGGVYIGEVICESYFV